MSFVKLPTDLLTVTNITASEKLMLAALIYFSIDDTNKTYIGNYKLADFLRTSRAAIVRSLKNLEKYNYIIINPRKNSSKSNEITLTVGRGIDFALAGAQNSSKGYQIDTPEETQFDTPKETQFDTRGYQIDTPHIDNRFKYLDLNLNTRETGTQFGTPRADSNIAPADGAAGRSMPDGEADAAADNMAKDVSAAAAQTELEDFCLVSAFFEVFPGLAAWVYLSRVGGYISMQPIGKMGERKLDEVKKEVAGWFELRGVKLAFLPVNEKLKGVVLNKEAA